MKTKSVKKELMTTTEIKLTRGLSCLVDTEDYPELSKFNWFSSKAGNHFYASRTKMVNSKPTVIRMHREILGLKPGDGLVADHINQNTLDNRRQNLRISNKQLNGMNRPGNNPRSGFKGVTFSYGKWNASISIKGKRLNLGYFKDKVEAAKFYDKKAKELFGEHAYLNFGEK